MAWGTSGWGLGAWGGHSEEEVEVEIAEAPRLGTLVLISSSLLELTFNRPVAVNADLYDTSNYNVSSVDDTLPPVTIDQILNVPTPSTARIYLRVRGTVLGSTYVLTARNIISTTGVALAPSGTRAAFLSRETKTDSIISSFSSLYSTDPTSIVGGLLHAISMSDDLIGGTGKRIVPVRVPPGFGSTSDAVAEFSSLTTLLDVQFTDLSTSSLPITWDWDFGNGS